GNHVEHPTHRGRAGLCRQLRRPGSLPGARAMKKLVLLRHGESLWNQENRFTGWTDVGLTPRGLAEAEAAGRLLKREGFEFDVAFTSVLQRAVKTLWTVLEQMDRMWIP